MCIQAFFGRIFKPVFPAFPMRPDKVGEGRSGTRRIGVSPDA